MRPHPFAAVPLALVAALASAWPLRAADDGAAATRQVAGANNAFAVDLYREFTRGRPGNLVFSPFSLSSALALTATGPLRELGTSLILPAIKSDFLPLY